MPSISLGNQFLCWVPEYLNPRVGEEAWIYDSSQKLFTVFHVKLSVCIYICVHVHV